MALPIYNNKYLGDFNGRRPRTNPITESPITRMRPSDNPRNQMPESPITRMRPSDNFGNKMPNPKLPQPPRRPITPIPNPKLPQPPQRPITPMPNPKLPQPPRRPPNFGRPNPMPVQPVGTAPAPPVDNKSPFANIEDAAKWAALNGWVKSPSPVGGNATPPAPVGTTPPADPRAQTLLDAKNKERLEAVAARRREEAALTPEEAARRREAERRREEALRRREQPGVAYQDEMY